MNTTNDAALARHNGSAPVQAHGGGAMAFLAKAQEMYQLATTIAQSDVIPDTFKRKPANVFMALEIATRLELGVFEVMQCIYQAPGGKYGFESRYIIGLANMRGPFDGPIWYEESGKGEGFTVTAHAKIKATGQTTSFSVSMGLARREGWAPNGKKHKSGKPVGNPKYESMPQLMLRYRAATLLIRTTCPEVLLGMHTREELEDVYGAPAPRYAEASPVGDPLDAVLPGPPSDHAIAASSPQTSPQDLRASTEYVPESLVAGLVKSYARLGMTLAYVDERFGPLDAMTRETYDEAVKEGTQRRQEWEAAQRKRDEEPEPAESLYGDDAEEVPYD